MISIALLLTGCAPFKFESPLPTDGPTMREIIKTFDQPPPAMAEPSGRLATRPPPPDRTDGLHGYTREAWTELDTRFPRLPNPTIIMYVFPHLSAEQTPVPGYSTMFPLYETVQFALPGEL